MTAAAQDLFSRVAHEAVAGDGPRDELDRYYTPPAVAVGCARWLAMQPEMSHLRERKRPHVLCPCAGDGAFLDAAADVWPRAHLHAQDIDPGATALYRHGLSSSRTADALAPPVDGPTYDLIIDNPPFRGADRYVAAMMGRAGVVALLLPLNYAEGGKRWRGIHLEYPPALIGVCIQRIAFKGPDKPSSPLAHAMFVWGVKRAPGADQLRGLDWRGLAAGGGV